MNYELAKELKDAGFPQGGDSDWYYLNGQTEPHVRHTEAIYREEVYIPTLSGLIEACGEEFNDLQRRCKDYWMATSNTQILQAFGVSPEEAVARLWLALRKK